MLFRHPYNDVMDRLGQRGWQEDAPTTRYWRYYKNNWRCYFDWYTKEFHFFRRRV